MIGSIRTHLHSYSVMTPSIVVYTGSAQNVSKVDVTVDETWPKALWDSVPRQTGHPFCARSIMNGANQTTEPYIEGCCYNFVYLITDCCKIMVLKKTKVITQSDTDGIRTRDLCQTRNRKAAPYH